ncbi:N-formylglutamate amidohydrolase [Ovoidimarina sediminis]|uniref:N-formylglutamate amidohydrolase n=1 Tax=Ovoidimarina sediminis TaxID=3079856 RepID=UPI0029108418|nr:N-formylglutamate amidohydrolase [Rhodophyticola sp. MJ-SS7]MDU8942089.1 N-formylglutamate amidohydrolase [Rhodophyticola sp. MJ-SS7]
MQPVAIAEPAEDIAPLVFDSPHSGSIYPETFDHAIDRMTLRRSEDAHIDEIFAHVTEFGGTLVHALFPRVFIDPNRNEDDIDLSLVEGEWTGPVNASFKTTERGVGLIWRDMKAFGPVYDRKLLPDEVRERIEGYWRPYHNALAKVIDARHAAFGRVIHIDCHSMASMGDITTEDGPVPRPDFVISDREGTTCAPALLECVVDLLRGEGFSVSVNDPYKGMELVRRHGRPEDGRHSLQVEINRKLYMDEATLSKRPGFHDTIATMRRLTDALRNLASTL